MKKYLLLLILPFIFLNNVKADTTVIDIRHGHSDEHSELYYLNSIPWTYWSVFGSSEYTSCSSRTDCYNQALSYFNSSNYNYYSMHLSINPSFINLYILPFNSSSGTLTQYISTGGGSNISRFRFYIDSDTTSNTRAIVLDGWSDPSYNNFYLFYDSNFPFINNRGNYVFRGFYDNESSDNYNDMLTINNGESIPKIKDLINHTSWLDYSNNHLDGYTTVNLDNYEYAILSLKNYNIDPFNTTFYVKGRIGITPVYNYGQSEKDTITDICNVNYSDYTPLRVYALEQDIQNHAVYYVKACESGSSFKFDSSLFNITYVTQENLSDPTVTINGNTYHTLPFSSLTNSANQNDENGFVPGEVTPGSGGLDSAIKNVQNKMSEIWGTFTYFTSFINQLFATLPVELRTVLISAFTIAIILGLIKIFAL